MKVMFPYSVTSQHHGTGCSVVSLLFSQYQKALNYFISYTVRSFIRSWLQTEREREGGGGKTNWTGVRHRGRISLFPSTKTRTGFFFAAEIF